MKVSLLHLPFCHTWPTSISFLSSVSCDSEVSIKCTLQNWAGSSRSSWSSPVLWIHSNLFTLFLQFSSNTVLSITLKVCWSWSLKKSNPSVVGNPCSRNHWVGHPATYDSCIYWDDFFQAICSTAYQCEFIKKIIAVQDLWWNSYLEITLPFIYAVL